MTFKITTPGAKKMQFNWLNEVIRVVDSATRTQQTGERIVIVDTKKRQVVERSFLEGWLRPTMSVKYFLVANTYSGKFAEGRVSVVLSDFKVERALNLEIKVEASCAHGREERVAQALLDGAHPADALSRLIDKWVRDYTRPQLATFIDNYFNLKSRLEANIATRALKEVGLTLKVNIALSGGDGWMEPIKISPTSLSVRLKDYDRAQGLKLETELLVADRHKIGAIVCRLDERGITERVKKHLLNYFAERVTLREFYNELNKPGFKLGLLTYLNEELKSIGRRVEFVYLEREEREGDDLPVEFFSAQRDLSYTIDGHPEPVIVRNTVQMICRDYTSFRISGSPNLDNWIGNNLEQVIRRVLFGKKYIDLLLDFKPLEREIKNKLRFSAATIGYEIQQLITIPDLEPYKWLESFTITADQTFETSLSRFPVRLNIGITARIQNLQDISDYLLRRQNVPTEMKEAVLDEIQESLHEIHPEQFYLHFKFSDNGDPVKKSLERRIRETLVRKFNAEIIAVTLEIADTEFTQWFDKLQAEMAGFTVKLTSHDPRDEGPVVFHGDCQIKGIDPNGWEKLQAVRWDISQIRDQFIKNLQSLMETWRVQDLAYLTAEASLQVRNTVERLARDYVLDKFGLLLEVSSVRREPTAVEVKLKELYQTVRNKEWEAEVMIEQLRIQELYRLKQHLMRLKVSEGGKAEIAKTEEQIAALEAYRPSTLLLGDASNGKAQLTESNQPTLTPGAVKPKGITDGETPDAEPDAP